MTEILHQIAYRNQLQLQHFTSLSGGDINVVYKLNTSQGDFVVKINDATSFPKLFETEAKGLQLLSNSTRFRIPEVIQEGTIENKAYLIMEYIQAGNPSSSFSEIFAERLAQLHQQSAPYFGLDHDNYLGSIPQLNKKWETSASFYINQRLIPLFKKCHDEGYPFSEERKFLKNVEQLLPKQVSNLIHGDLWNGNYLVDEQGSPVLIDPAVCYASREMDLAMMQLFGSFPKQLFGHYQDIFPMDSQWENRIEIWQLYYVLAHVVLFGGGYYNTALKIIQKYS